MQYRTTVLFARVSAEPELLMVIPVVAELVGGVLTGAPPFIA